ncbi:MAG: flagellar protein export ATPase FliI [Burkholderiales bacterium]
MTDASHPSFEGAVDRWRQHLRDCRSFARVPVSLEVHGRLVRVSGLVMEAVGLALPLGSTCSISQDGVSLTEAEVVGFSGNRLFLMPTTDVHGLTPGALVTPTDVNYVGPRFGRPSHPWRRIEDRTRHMPVGASLLGRVVDGNGRPLDRLGHLNVQETRPLRSRPINPIEREPIRTPLDVGVRAINALLTTGRGQRMGLFAGSGVGKSVLLGMMARYTTADVTVVGLIGERGREVKEFIEDILGEDGLARSVVVAAPADAPPLLRLQGAAYATSLAEHFRDEGKQVLLIMDSLTRYAMAQREIALAIGEPPATKGYPPSVFAKLPQLVERAGNGAANSGAITAFYTVLTEGDDPLDPIADAARAILDGHIVLSRSLAEQGQFPAVDIEASISRVMHTLSTDEELAYARRFRQLYSRYQRSRDLISVGAYVAGTDRLLDEAIALKPQLDAFLRQDLREQSTLVESKAALHALLHGSIVSN